MTALFLPVDKQRVHVPVVKQGRFTVERGIVKRQYRWVKFNDLPSMGEFRFFYDAAKDACREFLRAMNLKGLDMTTNEADVLIVGPYLHRVFGRSGWSSVSGRQTGEDKFEDLADFVVQANFLEHKLHLVEHYVYDR